MKTCRDCKKEKSLDQFSTRPNYNGTGTVYYKSHCKECMKKRMYKWIKKNKKKYNQYQRTYKQKK